MLIQLLINHPQALGTIVKNTPLWVGGLLAALTALGLSQVKTRTASAARVSVMPIVMPAMSIWAITSAFGASPMFGYGLVAWLVAAALAVCMIAPGAPARGTRYDSATRSFELPGSWVPMALILAIFLTRYVVNVELAMQPGLARDGQFMLVATALYGLCSGVFIGRAARLLRLAYRPVAGTAPAFNA